MTAVTHEQTQQFAQQQAQHALEQLAAAHGLLDKVDWGKLLPILIQLIQALRPAAP